MEKQASYKRVRARSVNFTKTPNSKTTDVIEMKAYLGLSYFARLYRSNYHNLEGLW